MASEASGAVKGRAWLLDGPDGYKTIRKADDWEVPAAGPGELRVKVACVGLNPADYKRAGWPRPTFTYPLVLGQDVAGTVDSVGEGVTGFAVGDRVQYHGQLNNQFGGFADYSTNTAETTVKIPDSVSFEDAAAVPCAAWTAYQALHKKLHIKGGAGTLVVAGASGGVGGMAVQLAKVAGVRCLGICSGKNKEFVLGLGADEVIDYTSDDVVARVKELTDGDGATWWFDTVSADSCIQGTETLAFGGALCSIGGTVDSSKVRDPMSRALSVSYCFLGCGHENHAAARAELGAMGRACMELLERKELSSLVSATDRGGFDDIPKGLEKLEGRRVVGKIVVTM